MVKTFPLPFLFSILVGTGCSDAPREKALIGHLAPLSGPEESTGASARRGVLLAVEEANEDSTTKGAGCPVEVRHADTRGVPSAFGAAATRLVAVNKVSALLGGSSPAEIEEIKHIDRPGVLLISPCGLVHESLGGKGLFFTGLSPGQQGGALAELAVREKLGRIVVLVSAESETGRYRAVTDAFIEKYRTTWKKQHSGAEAALAGPRRYGKEITVEERARAIAGELGGTGPGKKPEAIFIAGKVSDLVKLRTVLGGKTIPVLFAGDEGSTSRLLEEAHARDDVFLATAYSADGGGARMEKFVARFKKRFDGREPDVHAALAYDNARLLFQALRGANSLVFDEVQQELAATKDFPGLTGPLSFDDDGQARRTVFIVRIEGGRPKTVATFSSAARPNN